MGYKLFILRENEFIKFIQEIDAESKARLVRDISFLKEYGINLKMPLAKRINRQLWELRINGRQRVRIIYTIIEKQIYVVHWFIKKTQKIPKRDLKISIRRLTEI